MVGEKKVEEHLYYFWTVTLILIIRITEFPARIGGPVPLQPITQLSHSLAINLDDAALIQRTFPGTDTFFGLLECLPYTTREAGMCHDLAVIPPAVELGCVLQPDTSDDYVLIFNSHTVSHRIVKILSGL